jgi:hypothetical protein
MSEKLPPNSTSEYERLRGYLLPILAAASIGDFSNDIVLPRDESSEFQEILAGVQILLETIREQERTVHESREAVKAMQNRAAVVLDDVLRRSFQK